MLSTIGTASLLREDAVVHMQYSICLLRIILIAYIVRMISELLKLLATCYPQLDSTHTSSKRSDLCAITGLFVPFL